MKGEPAWLEVTGLRHRVTAGVIAAVLAGSSGLAFSLVRPLRAAPLLLVVFAASLATLFCLVPTTRCADCDEWVLEWMWKTPRSLFKVYSLDSCPNCGSRGRMK
ncbi:MAG: hypothetical protein U0229_12315 [Anaeromyxobacter sp.]